MSAASTPFALIGVATRFRGPKIALLAAVLLALLVPVHGLANEEDPCRELEEQREDRDPLDPSNYARLTWNGREVVQPGLGKVYEVIGSSGELKIDLEKETMKKLWEFDTRGSLSIRGWVVPATGDRRNIEIEGYSKIGETLTVNQLHRIERTPILTLA